MLMLYLKACFLATSAITAANHDEFLKNFIEFRQINPLISLATCEKITLHFWYLNDELASSSLFDDTIPFNNKFFFSLILIPRIIHLS